MPNKQFLEIATIDECEGKDARNYTFLQYYENPTCKKEYIPGPDKLISCDQNGKLTVNQLQILSIRNVDIGGKFKICCR